MPPKILLIDDDAGVLNMLRINMQDQGYEVLVGMDGQEAIQIAFKNKPDLIVMDVNMPMYNGLRALEALRKRPDTSQIPVILLTGAQSDTVYPALEAHARVTFIKKPVDLESINSLVRQLLDQYSQGQ